MARSKDDEAIDNAFSMILKQVIGKVYAQKNRDKVSTALLFFLVRAANSWRSIVTLLVHSENHETYTIDAAVILRCIFDAYLQANLIYQDPDERDERAELYLDYAHIDKYKAQAKPLQHKNEFSDKLSANPNRPKMQPLLKAEYDRVKSRYFKKHRSPDGTVKLGPDIRDKWYEGTLPDLAKHAGKGDEYDTFITPFSGSVHSSAYSVEVGPLLKGDHLSLLASGFTARIVRLNVEHNKISLNETDLEILEIFSKSLLNVRT